MTAESPRGPRPDPLALLASARTAWAAGRRDEAARRWRMAAAVTPGDAAPYVNLAGAAGPASADTVWVERAAAAIAVGDPLVARNLGVLAQGRGETERAARSVRRSLILAPDRGATLSVFARLPTVRRGDEAPLRWSVRAAVSTPSVEAVWLDVVTRLCRAGRDTEASARADAIAIPMPAWSSELLALVAELGLRTDRLQRSADALALLTERAPDDVTFRTLRAVLLRRRRDLPAAAREGRRAAILRPDLFDCVGSAATAFGFNDQHPEAVRQFRRCLLIDPARRLDILENYGGSLVHTGALPAAARVLREALVRQPERPAGYMNLSSMRFQSGDLAAAVRLGEFALLVERRLADAWYNLGSLRRHQGRLEEARRLLDGASAIEDRPYYRFVRAMLELGDGDPQDGLRRYESRWDVTGFSSSRRLGAEPTLALPVWRGEVRRDATLAVWGEQGVGDEIWFAGYLDWAVERVGAVVLEVGINLVGLLQRSFPGVRVLAREHPRTEAALQAADLQVPMGGVLLPAGAGTRPAPVGYLRTDAARTARLRERYTAGRPGARVIGVSWRSVKPTRHRSFESPLAEWGPVFGLDDAVFVSLQYGDVSADVRLVRERFGVDLLVDPEIDAYRNLDALASQVAAMDTVVSIANSTVALAHGLGRPVHVIARNVQDDWRYARGAETTRWLPTARCVWQTDGRDWATPIAVLADQLRR